MFPLVPREWVGLPFIGVIDDVNEYCMYYMVGVWNLVHVGYSTFKVFFVILTASKVIIIFLEDIYLESS